MHHQVVGLVQPVIHLPDGSRATVKLQLFQPLLKLTVHLVLFGNLKFLLVTYLLLGILILVHPLLNGFHPTRHSLDSLLSLDMCLLAVLACPAAVIPKLLTHQNPLEKIWIHIQAAWMPPELAYATPDTAILVGRYILGGLLAYRAGQLVGFGFGLDFIILGLALLLATSTSRTKVKALGVLHHLFTDLC